MDYRDYTKNYNGGDQGIKTKDVITDDLTVSNGLATASIKDDAITQAKMATGATGKDELKYEQKTVTIAAAATGTATFTTGAILLGWYVSAITGTAFVKKVDLTGTTLTVTLSASDTATIIATFLKA